MPSNPDDFMKPTPPSPDEALVDEFEQFVENVVDNLVTKTQEDIERILKDISSNPDFRNHFGEQLTPRFGREVREKLSKRGRG